MSISLYDITIPSYLQTLTAIRGVLKKGAGFCQEKGIDPQSLVETRLAEDMFPLRFQVVSVAHHSIGAIEGLKKGTFGPPGVEQPQDYKGLQDLLDRAEDALRAVTPAEVNELQGRDMAFQMRDFRIPFLAETFILSFSLPNFYFHAATTYDILRMKGVPLGKRDYLGQMRMKA
ncbi:MAG: DUF1993 family protein [Alphaproteobacteria bacterium]|nr:DUF1993 family protein [Alphaproteobacteria bacterium]